MTGNRWALAFRSLAALVLALAAFAILGPPVLRYMAEVGADALLAVIAAVTPP